MYAFIRGRVDSIAADHAVLDAGGVGYELNCSRQTLSRLNTGAEAKLFTHLHLAEGVMALYGFIDDVERQMFRRLISVTRVGPKLALSVLSVLTPVDVAAAVVTDNAAAFDHVPGMGRKTAQRVLLELKEKVAAVEMLNAGLPAAAAEPSDIRSEAVAALVSLGYDGMLASRAVSAVDDADTIEELLTKALRTLARS